MKLFACADLHLGFSSDKPMNIFGDHWNEHYAKIKRDWYEKVTDDDLVIVAGDVSWAMRMEDALVDLEWVNALPGKKVFVKGNHDYWWQSLSKMQGRFDTITYIHNNYYASGGLAICGSRGWSLPGSESFQKEDEKIYQREIRRLERSLELASQDPSVKHIVVALHYPPLQPYSKDNELVALLKKYEIKEVVYGHLHDEYSWNFAIKGEFEGINYHLVSVDYLDFGLKEIDYEK